MLASTKASDTAGPAVCAATSPVSEKMPAPTVQPTPKAVSPTMPSERLRRGPSLPKASAVHVSTALRDQMLTLQLAPAPHRLAFFGEGPGALLEILGPDHFLHGIQAVVHGEGGMFRDRLRVSQQLLDGRKQQRRSVRQLLRDLAGL